MSQSSSDADVIAAFQADLVGVFAIYAMSALVAYEYMITVNQEARLIWRRKWSLATWIFMANRYVMVAAVIMTSAPTPTQSCNVSYMLNNILNISQDVIFAAFSTLRIFAIWNHDLRVALLVFALGMVPVATNTYGLTRETSVVASSAVLGSYCSATISITANVVLEFSIGTRIAVIFSDIILLVLTWCRTFRHWVEARKFGIQSLSGVVLRDGTGYFMALLAINIGQVLGNAIPSLYNVSPLVNIIVALQPILVSRFLLNLRQVAEPQNGSSDIFNSRFSVPGFRVPTLASIIGNMGEDLHHGPDIEEWDDVAEDSEPQANGSVPHGEVAALVAATDPRSGMFFINTEGEIQEVPVNAIV